VVVLVVLPEYFTGKQRLMVVNEDSVKHILKALPSAGLQLFQWWVFDCFRQRFDANFLYKSNCIFSTNVEGFHANARSFDPTLRYLLLPTSLYII
jgi:hypothetical protein